MAGDKAGDRRESLDSGRERNAVTRSQEPDTGRMDFFNGLLGLTGTCRWFDNCPSLRSLRCHTKTAGMSRDRDIAGYDRNAQYRKRALHGASFPVTVHWMLSSGPARESRRREFRASAGLPFHPAAVGPPSTAGYWCKPAPLPLQRGKNIQTRNFVKKKCRKVADRRGRTTVGCEPNHAVEIVSALRPFFVRDPAAGRCFPQEWRRVRVLICRRP